MIVTQILEQMRKTSSKTEKEEILQQHKDSKLLQRIFKLAYSPEYNFWIKKIPEYTNTGVVIISLTQALDLLEEQIASRLVTGDDAKALIVQILSTCEEHETLKRVILRDLEVGATAGTANKVWKDLVLDPPYLGYQLFSESKIKKFKLPCFSQVKQDGLYCDLFVNSDGCFYRSRSGNELKFKLPAKVEKQLQKTFKGYVLNCEALVINNELSTGVEPREIGNGYLNSDEVDPERVMIRIWDMIDVKSYHNRKSTIEYKVRWDTLLLDLDTWVLELPGDQRAYYKAHVQPVESVWCTKTQDIIDHFIKCRKAGLEGTVCKQPFLLWSDTKTSDGLKLKNLFDFEGKCVGYIPHKKNPNMIGSLCFESACGKVQFNCGSGLTDALRKEFFKRKDTLPGMICSLRGNMLSQSETKGEDVWSINLPRFIEERKDKRIADTYEQILEQQDSILDLLRKIK